MRSIDELIELNEPGWPDVQSWINDATNDVTVFPPDESFRVEALLATQVTTRSTMGAIIYESGGLVVDRGWLRILGGGCPDFTRSLPRWNRECGTMTEGSSPPFLLVADDVAGGFFAINGGSLGDDAGNVYYFAPDTLDWEPMGFGYTNFIHWALSGDLQTFYEEFRWTDWASEIAGLSPSRTMFFYPLLWTEAESVDSRHRGTVPVLESYNLQFDFARQINGHPT